MSMSNADNQKGRRVIYWDWDTQHVLLQDLGVVGIFIGLTRLGAPWSANSGGGATWHGAAQWNVV